MKGSGADLTILPPVKNSESFSYRSGEVIIRAAEKLTIERALFLLEQTRLEIWALSQEKYNV